jgi:hypothetical protein
MARPVKETPVLTGREALQFEKAVKKNENQKVPREQYERAENFFKSVKVAFDTKQVGT